MTTSPTADRYELAAAIAARLYGARPLARWVPSEECDVFVLDFGGALPHKVIKLERPGSWVVAKEQRLLPFLRRHGLEVPVIEHGDAGETSATHEADLPSSVPAAPVRYTVMAFVGCAQNLRMRGGEGGRGGGRGRRGDGRLSPGFANQTGEEPAAHAECSARARPPRGGGAAAAVPGGPAARPGPATGGG